MPPPMVCHWSVYAVCVVWLLGAIGDCVFVDEVVVRSFEVGGMAVRGIGCWILR